jgi:large subunit ribosomal protein L9
MKLILLEKVQKLGNLGDTVRVRAGYGRNFLVPQGKAVPATAANVAMFESRRSELEAAAQDRLGTAERRREALTDLVLQLTANASEEGKLFGSIGPRDIAEAATEKGFALEKSEVVMGEGPIRALGEFNVVVHLHADVETTIKVVVSPEVA